MAKLNKIVRRNPLSRFTQVAPTGGAGFALLADGLDLAYERLEPAAIEEQKRRGMEAGQQAAADQFDVDIEPGAAGTVSSQGQAGNAAWRDAIASIESAGSGDYSAIGPETAKGNRAYGRYQVMDFNIGPWTEKHLGKRMTPQEFLNDREAQDRVFDAEFGANVEKYGSPQEAASVWFTGRPISQGSGAKDILGTSGSDYVSKFNRSLGQRAISADTSGTISTQGKPSITIRTSDGKLQQRLYSPFSGPILQAYNTAAKVAYQAEILEKGTTDLLEISQQFPLDAEGFAGAAKEYVDQIVEAAPSQLKPYIREELEAEATRRVRGVMTEYHRDTQQRANNSSRALVERYSDEYAEAIASGDQGQITAAQSRLDGVLQAREKLPGVAWTEEQSANVFIDSRKAGERLIERQKKQQAADAKEEFGLIIESAKRGLTADNEAILNDPAMTALHPELAQEALAFTVIRDQMPEFLKLTPDQMEEGVRELRGKKITGDLDIKVIDAMDTIAKNSRRAWNEDPVAAAQQAFKNNPPPELPDLTADDPSQFTTALSERVRYMNEEVFAGGYTDTQAYLNKQESEALATALSKDMPPELRAALSAAIVDGAGPAAVRIFDEIDGDRLTQFSGKMMAVGANPVVATEILRGQKIMSEGTVSIPTESTVRDMFNGDFAPAFAGLPGGIEAQADAMMAARAIYANRAGGAELDDAGKEDLMRQSINAALGGSKNKRGHATGGVQTILKNQTLLPVGVSGIDVEAAMQKALTGTAPHKGRGPLSAMGNLGAALFDSTSYELDPEVWAEASDQGTPTLGGIPTIGGVIPKRLIDGGNVRLIAAGQQGYRMEVTIGSGTYDATDANGKLFFFDLNKLMEAAIAPNAPRGSWWMPGSPTPDRAPQT
ncbi:hypothetical protein SAMN05444398_101859 [Roseovarius pacificus]|uniref:Uncharacterized protein n=1 Tax=Roseovarius pacificus TaxID=337701 RepID=A0A1M6YGZ6_9RHOB|nr:hypothetical protein [Roseovarius pacificus]GGO50874.1 hypothetical protein GCM10011315_02680 [Roseovarius pacificus]SHL17546.1 hypothetical protein SAMN05444398_101859 [Roseovarius pacificus]